MKSEAEVKIIGEVYNGCYTCGLTMLGSESMKEFKKIKDSLEKYMVETVHKMDGEFGHKMVEQDLTASAFKRALREQKQQGKK